jgi:reactive intermediate/imine deaminase
MPRHRLIRADGLSEPISHYSDAVRAGDTIYVSGQASLDRHGTLVGAGDVVAQTRQVLDNMKLALAAAGATLDDVVKVTVYLAHCADRPRVNEVRQAYFGANKPASTLVGIAEFAIPGMLVEVDAVAVAGRRRPGRASGARRPATKTRPRKP